MPATTRSLFADAHLKAGAGLPLMLNMRSGDLCESQVKSKSVASDMGRTGFGAAARRPRRRPHPIVIYFQAPSTIAV